jgi:hypothetical protein
LGDSVQIRIFGAASSPESLSQLLDHPAPTMAELAQCAEEIEAAAYPLRSALDKWKGSDALRYLEKRRPLGEGPRLSLGILDTQLTRLMNGFADIEAPEARRGRRIQGGRANVTAKAIASLWSRCGLGEPKLSPQSRFIRACSVVLPWHGIHKADVSQFMRSELAKRQKGHVVIG